MYIYYIEASVLNYLWYNIVTTVRKRYLFYMPKNILFELKMYYFISFDNKIWTKLLGKIKHWH